MKCFKNGMPVHDVELMDRAFHYGDGCFTTAKLIQGKIQCVERHISRLEKAIQALHLKADLSLIQKSITLSGIENATIKVVISRGVGQRGYSLPQQPADVWIFIYPQQSQLYIEPSVIESGVLSQKIGLSMPELVGLKTLNRLEQVLLKAEADQKCLKEALVVDIHERIVEGISSNCFLYIDGQWFTPELRYNGVHGIMRAEILERMQRHGISCLQQELPRRAIEQIESLFFCNALTPMQIASSLDGRQLDPQICVSLFHTLQLQQMN